MVKNLEQTIDVWTKNYSIICVLQFFSYIFRNKVYIDLILPTQPAPAVITPICLVVKFASQKSYVVILFLFGNRLFEQASKKNASVMASQEVVI